MNIRFLEEDVMRFLKDVAKTPIYSTRAFELIARLKEVGPDDDNAWRHAYRTEVLGYSDAKAIGTDSEASGHWYFGEVMDEVAEDARTGDTYKSCRDGSVVNYDGTCVEWSE